MPVAWTSGDDCVFKLFQQQVRGGLQPKSHEAYLDFVLNALTAKSAGEVER